MLKRQGMLISILTVCIVLVSCSNSNDPKENGINSTPNHHEVDLGMEKKYEELNDLFTLMNNRNEYSIFTKTKTRYPIEDIAIEGIEMLMLELMRNDEDRSYDILEYRNMDLIVIDYEQSSYDLKLNQWLVVGSVEIRYKGSLSQDDKDTTMHESDFVKVSFGNWIMTFEGYKYTLRYAVE